MSRLRWKAFRRMSWVWLAWERVWIRLHPLTPIGPGSLFHYRLDRDVLELHLDGTKIAELRSRPGYSGWKVIHELREDLKILAGRVRNGELGRLRGIKGTSLMAEAGSILGFDVRPLPHTLGARLEQFFMVGLDALYHPRGLRTRSMDRWPAESWMGVDELLKRY